MTFTKILKNIFSRKTKAENLDNSFEGKAKRFFSKISGSFMLPISVMAIAGLFLGVGNAIYSQTSAKTFGLFIKNLGDPVFAAMPLLFMIAVVVVFTDDVGTSVFASSVAFLVFLSIQTPFIHVVSNDKENIHRASILFNLGDNIESKLYSLQTSILGIQTLNTSIFGGIIVGLIMS